MALQSVSVDDLRRLIAAELSGHEDEVDIESQLVILKRDRDWWVTLRHTGGLVDEARHAAVAAAGRRLGQNFSLMPHAIVDSAGA